MRKKKKGKGATSSRTGSQPRTLRTPERASRSQPRPPIQPHGYDPYPYTKGYVTGQDFIECTTEKLRLVLTREQFDRFRAIYDVSARRNCEMIALGHVELDNRLDEITIKEMLIPKQKGTGASTDVLPEAMAELIMKGQKVNFWFHTHPGMTAFWSGTDDQTARELCGKAEFTISVVIASEHAMKARLDIHTPVKLMISIPIKVDESPYDNPYMTEYEKVFKKSVKFTPPPPVSYAYRGNAYNHLDKRKRRGKSSVFVNEVDPHVRQGIDYFKDWPDEFGGLIPKEVRALRKDAESRSNIIVGDDDGHAKTK